MLLKFPLCASELRRALKSADASELLNDPKSRLPIIIIWAKIKLLDNTCVRRASVVSQEKKMNFRINDQAIACEITF